MNINSLILKTKVEQEYSERQVKQSIKTIRSILDRIEIGIENNTIKADEGLQGNEWVLYKELSNLERLNAFIKQLENVE